MNKSWSDMGCPFCRSLWEAGQLPPFLADDLDDHSSLHCCPRCGAFWKQTERGAYQIERSAAARQYPAAFGASGALLLNPVNQLESLMCDTMQRKAPVKMLMGLLVASPVFVAGEIQSISGQEGFSPVSFDRGGVWMIACFSDRSRVGQFTDEARYCIEMTGADFVNSIPAEHGFVMNPGWNVGFEISPDGVVRLRQEVQRSADAGPSKC